jgi:hypothetical protein
MYMVNSAEVLVWGTKEPRRGSSTRSSKMEPMSLTHPHSSQGEARTPSEKSQTIGPSAEQVALAEAWRSVDNAVRSIFELARSLELLGDAIQRFETEPLLEYQESDYSRYRA